MGESGSGKSTLAKLILGLLPDSLSPSWNSFRIWDREIPNQDFSAWEEWRGARMSYIPQSAALGLHPFLSIGSQILEYFSLRRPELANEKIGLELLRDLGLIHPEAAWKSRPHELSGGERQRVLILLAIHSGSDLILADEPTSALDPETGRAILDLLRERVRGLGTTLLFISHDLASACSLADTITILKSGKKVETLRKSKEEWTPGSEYARKLFTLEEKLA